MTDDPDYFLRRYRVVDGMAGLDFDFTTLMAYGSTDKIQLVVTYDVSVVRLLNIDFKFRFRQCSQTVAWGNGISLIEKEQDEISDIKEASVWDMKNVTGRGSMIVGEEKKSYTYTSSGYGFDAYDNSNGKNEFVSVVTVNVHDDYYNTETLKQSTAVSHIKSRANAAYSNMVTNVGALDETIKMDTDSGKESITSEKTTRTYRVILVVPEDAGEELMKAVEDSFRKQWNGQPVVLQVKKAYGSPSGTEEKKTEE